MKMIVEADSHGFYVYFETDEHYKEAKRERKTCRAIQIQDLENDCQMRANDLFVLDLGDQYPVPGKKVVHKLKKKKGVV